MPENQKKTPRSRECRHIHRHSRESGNPKAIGSKCVFASYRIPDSRFRGNDGIRRLETDILELTTPPRITKRNPDSKPNSDTTPASDGQTQRPEMAANDREIEFSKLNSDTTPASDGQTQRPEMATNGREIEFSELTFRQQAALPRIALGRLWDRATPYGSLRSVIPAKAGIQG